MLETGITPDFIVIDGAEGGPGAAPIELSDHVGIPLREGLLFAVNCLLATGLREKIRLVASGKFYDGHTLAANLALGADWCNAGRAFMFSVGCVQTKKCHTDRCPTGVATQNYLRQRVLVVADKAEEQAGLLAGHRLEAELVDEQEGGRHVLAALQPRRRHLGIGAERGHQLVEAEVLHREAELHRLHAEGDAQMRLAAAG